MLNNGDTYTLHSASSYSSNKEIAISTCVYKNFLRITIRSEIHLQELLVNFSRPYRDEQFIRNNQNMLKLIMTFLQTTKELYYF